MSDELEFNAGVERNIRALTEDRSLHQRAHELIRDVAPHGYTYNFTWMGRPIIQMPQDIIALQEIIWRVRPQAIVETGVARGGSMVFYASMLEMMQLPGRVIGIDIDIRAHNRAAIEGHPMAHRIDLVEGSSIEQATFEVVQGLVGDTDPVLLILDSNHTHEHVLAELRLYAQLLRPGGWIVVLDTIVEYMPKSLYPDRPWGPGDNPLTAVDAFLAENARFERDPSIDGKLLLTMAPRGWLRCVA